VGKFPEGISVNGSVKIRFESNGESWKSEKNENEEKGERTKYAFNQNRCI
jgi:hypothetical protein